MPDPVGWLQTLWAVVDERLAELSAKLQKVVGTLRLVAALLVVAILMVLASPVVLILWPRYFPIAYAVSTVILLIPLVVLTVLVLLPLRMKSVVRLIDKGYPANARELGIRIVARKLRDQSIETEELLVETAINEGRKVVERYRARAAAMAADEEAASGDRPSGTPPSGGSPVTPT